MKPFEGVREVPPSVHQFFPKTNAISFSKSKFSQKPNKLLLKEIFMIRCKKFNLSNKNAIKLLYKTLW
jgi:hypothetical protein